MIDVDSVLPSRQQLRDLTGELRRQPRSFIQALMDAVHVQPHLEQDLSANLWGDAPSTAQLHTAAAHNLSTGIARRRAVLKDSVSRRAVAATLDKSEQAVSA